MQDFLNTLDVELGTDAFADAASASAWLRSQGFATQVGPKRLDLLRSSRDVVRALVELNPTAKPAAKLWRELTDLAEMTDVRLTVSRAGAVELAPVSGGLAGLFSELFLAIDAANREGSWARLKTCGRCRWAYFDVTKNRSAAWCTARCSQRAKARRYYARHARR